jgi:putative transposase
MASSFVVNLVHYVWSTSERRPMIERTWQDRLYGYIGGILRNKSGHVLCAGGMPDHIHLFVSLPSTMSIALGANVLKSNSSAWAHENIAGKDMFRWQAGYGAFTVSKSGEESVMRYIENQEEHHRRQTFETEFIALLDKHEVEYDERYVFD